MKLIAHIGAPKTGTTYVQRMLKASETALGEQGAVYVGPDKIRNSSEWKSTFSYYRGNGTTNELMSLKPFSGDGDTVILSEESLTHDLMPSQWSGGGFSRIERTADILEMLAQGSIHVVLSVRRQDLFIASVYTHFLHRHGLSKDFEGWFLNTVAPTQLSWAKVIQHLSDRFGNDNVSILPFDDFGGNLQNLTKAIVALAGVYIPDVGLTEEKKWVTNPSLSDLGAKLALEINRAMPEFPNKREKMVSALIQEFPAREFGKFSLDESATQSILSHLYGDENRQIAQDWGFAEDSKFLF